MYVRLQSLLAVGIGLLWATPASAAQGNAGVATESPLATDADTAEVYSVSAQPAKASFAAKSGWEISAGPYLWMAGLKGDMGVAEEVAPVAIGLSFGDILSHLKFTLMGNFEARHGHFVATGDLLFLKMGASDNIDIREVDFLDADLQTSTFVTTLTAGYRVVDKGRQSLDLFAGGRINSMKTELDLTGPRRSFSGSKTETWVDPVIGLRLQAPMDQRWSLAAYGDIGGFGMGSDLSWQLMGVAKYELSRRWSMSGGWRHLDIDYHKNGFVFDAAMDGPILGATYRF